MAIDTMPRTPGTPRQPPGRTTPPRPPGRTVPPCPNNPTNPRNPRDLGTRPLPAPRHTRPVTGPGARRAAGRRPRQPRAPFILLLVGLLGGALVSLLVISTTLAEGSYKITSLQRQNTALAKQEQVLTEQVAQASSPAWIAQQAEQLGMQQNPDLRFIDLKTGKIVAGKVSQADAAINVPGYTP